jgi:hypothetical protein
MSALDHMLSALNIMLKSGEQADAQKAAEREAKRAAQSATSPRRQRSFSGPQLSDDPSCCLAKRRVVK